MTHVETSDISAAKSSFIDAVVKSENTNSIEQEFVSNVKTEEKYEPEFVCTLCSRPLNSKKTLERHKRLKHSAEVM